MKRAALLVALLAGCGGDAELETVVVYTSVDSIFAESLFAEFTRQTGVRVLAVYDTEETKALGLARRILAERGAPQADVFWNGEIMRTCMLEAEGALEPYASPSAADIPAAWKTERWTGFGARARVIVYHTRIADPPRRWEELTDARWKGRVAIANPQFGTTAAHAAALYQLWGAQKARDFFVRLKANDVRIVGGNSHVRDLVARGECDVGLTDTDDVWVGIDRGDAIQMVEAEPRVLIPNTAGLISGAPHPQTARKFLDFLVHADREKMMAEGRARQIPLRGTPASSIDWARAHAGSEAALKEIKSLGY